MNTAQGFARQPLAVAVALVFGAVGAHAATITVSDGGDAGTPTTCTLRQALAAAGSDSADDSSCTAGNGVDTIVFTPELANSTITLADGELQVETSLSIAGSGQTIDAGGKTAVLQVFVDHLSDPIAVSLSDLTLTGGYATGYSTRGGGISTFCQSPPERQGRRGGAGVAGSASLSSLALSGVKVVNNSSSSNAGGIYLCDVALDMDQSTVSGNTVVGSGNYAGGGIFAANSLLTVTDSTISGNSVSSDASYLSGGLYAWNTSATLTNSTIAGNSASGQNHLGGGVVVSAYGAALPVALNDCTVSANGASSSNGSTAVVGGVLVGAWANGAVLLGNSIDAGNTGISADALIAPSSDKGTVFSAQFSLLGSDLAATYAGNGNVFSDSPGLAALANNGGPTHTMALQAGSPAIDAGSNALIPAGVGSDQRGAGFPRIANGTVDIGAFEAQPAAPPTQAVAAPTLSTWAIVLLVGLLGWVGLARRPQRH